jgi:N-acetylglutamate synthase-like GNAT family acetyltransferase
MLIRSYEPTDQAAVMRLHTDGVLIGGHSIDETTDDYADMKAAYFRRPQDHFWVAEAGGQVIGMIGLVEKRPHIGVIRRLRVAPAWQEPRTIRRLVKTAVRHCARQGGLKVVVDAPCNSRRAIRFLGDLGFQYTRTRNTEGRDLIEFYLNLYQHDESLDSWKPERGMP